MHSLKKILPVRVKHQSPRSYGQTRPTTRRGIRFDSRNVVCAVALSNRKYAALYCPVSHPRAHLLNQLVLPRSPLLVEFLFWVKRSVIPLHCGKSKIRVTDILEWN